MTENEKDSYSTLLFRHPPRMKKYPYVLFFFLALPVSIMCSLNRFHRLVAQMGTIAGPLVVNSCLYCKCFLADLKHFMVYSIWSFLTSKFISMNDPIKVYSLIVIFLRLFIKPFLVQSMFQRQNPVIARTVVRTVEKPMLNPSRKSFL